MYFPQTYNIDYRRFSMSSRHIIWYHLHEKKTKWITYSLLFLYTQNMSERAYKKHNSGCLREEELSVAHSERVFMGSRIVLLPQIMATKKATNKSSHLLRLSILPSTPHPLATFSFSNSTIVHTTKVLIHAPSEPFKVVPGRLWTEASLFLRTQFPWGGPFSSSNAASQLLLPAQRSPPVLRCLWPLFPLFQSSWPYWASSRDLLCRLLRISTNFRSLHLIGFLQGLSQGLAHTWLSLFIELCTSMKVVDGWMTYSARRRSAHFVY